MGLEETLGTRVESLLAPLSLSLSDRGKEGRGGSSYPTTLLRLWVSPVVPAGI